MFEIASKVGINRTSILSSTTESRLQQRLFGKIVHEKAKGTSLFRFPILSVGCQNFPTQNSPVLPFSTTAINPLLRYTTRPSFFMSEDSSMFHSFVFFNRSISLKKSYRTSNCVGVGPAKCFINSQSWPISCKTSKLRILQHTIFQQKKNDYNIDFSSTTHYTVSWLLGYFVWDMQGVSSDII